MNEKTGSLQQRLLASALYLGLAPFLRRAAVARMTPFGQQHCAQALAAFAILGILLLIASLYFAVGTYFVIYHRELSKSELLQILGLISECVAGLVILYAWGAGLFFAVRGRNGNIPGLSWLSRHSMVVALGRVAGILMFSLALLLTTVA